jgi:hypothetical protein
MKPNTPLAKPNQQKMLKKKSKGPKIDPKVALAQQQNEYIKRLSAFWNAFFDEDIVRLIPRKTLNALYATRIRMIALNPIPSPGHVIPELVVKSVKTIVTSHFKNRLIKLQKSNRPVSLYDFATLGFQMYSFLQASDQFPFKDSDRIYKLLSEYFNNLDEIFDALYDELNGDFLTIFQYMLNNFTEGYYAIELGGSSEYKNSYFSSTFPISIKQYPSEKEQFVINKLSRPAYRIGWSFPHNRMEWFSVTPEKLGIKTTFNQFKFPVYLQAHAFHRLIERIDCIYPIFITEGIISSIAKCVAIADGNDFLIEFRINNVKVGYLKATLIDGKLLVRTFLFLTCKDTPEGKRLETHLGLTKFDTIYLKMDRLSTFMTDHLHHNKELRNLFIKADCRDLVNLYDQLDRFSSMHPLNSPLEKLTGYLTTNDIQLPNWEAIAVD